jgi:hypothetical protein
MQKREREVREEREWTIASQQDRRKAQQTEGAQTVNEPVWYTRCTLSVKVEVQLYKRK